VRPGLRDGSLAVLKYVAVLGIGLALFMLLAPMIGYQTYGDRPEAGWVGWFPGIDWAAFPSYLEFVAEFLLILVLPWAAVLFIGAVLLVRYLERQQFPRPLVAIAGATVAMLTTGYALLGAAWTVSLGLAPLVVGMGLGAYVGGCQLPKRVA